MLHVAGAIEESRHDWILYVRSGLEENFPDVLEIGGVRFRIYGDSCYNQKWCLEVPMQGANWISAQMAFNKATSQVRITVQRIFKQGKMYLAKIDYKWKMKVVEAPIGLLYLSSMLLCNFQICIYPN